MLAGMAGAKDVEFVTGADDVRLRHLYQHAWATVTLPPSVERSDQSALEPDGPRVDGLRYSGGCVRRGFAAGVRRDRGDRAHVSSGDMLSVALGSICTDRGSTVLMGLQGGEVESPSR